VDSDDSNAPRKSGFSKPNAQQQIQAENMKNEIDKLQHELVKQESLIEAYQKDNKKLYNQLKTAQVRS